MMLSKATKYLLLKTVFSPSLFQQVIMALPSTRALVLALLVTSAASDPLIHPPSSSRRFLFEDAAAHASAFGHRALRSPPPALNVTYPPPLPQRTADAMAEVAGAFAHSRAAPAPLGECRPAAAADPCAYVLSNPFCDFERVNYLRIHYCVAASYPSPVIAICAAIWIALLFCVLSITADSFFAPAVQNIASWLGMSADVAGATLLALGNGGPDFFTQARERSPGPSLDLLVPSLRHQRHAAYSITAPYRF